MTTILTDLRISLRFDALEGFHPELTDLNLFLSLIPAAWPAAWRNHTDRLLGMLLVELSRPQPDPSFPNYHVCMQHGRPEVRGSSHRAMANERSAYPSKVLGGASGNEPALCTRLVLPRWDHDLEQMVPTADGLLRRSSICGRRRSRSYICLAGKPLAKNDPPELESMHHACLYVYFIYLCMASDRAGPSQRSHPSQRCNQMPAGSNTPRRG